MSIYEFAALAAALSWAITGLVASAPSKSLGAFTFSRLRMSFVFVLLALFATVMDTWSSVPSTGWTFIILSGLVGIFLGDTALFIALNRLGPRATAILFAGNAPITVLLGWAILGESLAFIPLLGAIVAFFGIIIAIAFGKASNSAHDLETVSGPLWIGIACGLFAATCQAAGTILIRPVMETAVGGVAPDPIAVSAVRVGISALALQVAAFLPIKAMKRTGPLTAKNLGLTALSGFLAMGVGMTLIVFALSGGQAGIVATLSATTPVLILPLLWIVTKEAPRKGSWIGAALTVVGSAMIFSG
ncbi:MAG: DMT family transporter [Pseudomonadota bacterium]